MAALAWTSCEGEPVHHHRGTRKKRSVCDQKNKNTSSGEPQKNKGSGQAGARQNTSQVTKRVVEIRRTGETSSPSSPRPSKARKPGSTDKGAKGKKPPAAVYVPRTLDPTLEKMRKRHEKWETSQSKETGAVRKKQKEKRKRERREKLVLRSSLPREKRPTKLSEFKQVPHLPPVAQYYAGTCWSFCSTSFMESEILRKSGGKTKIKLSELATVYWEYVAKAGGFVDTRGASHFGQGSEANALLRAFSQHGAWPAEAYKGTKWPDGKHDHQRLMGDLKAVLSLAESQSLWDKVTLLSMIQVVLDRDLGRPPSRFKYKGKSYDPKSFLKDVLQLDPGDYVSFMSTVKRSFYKTGEFKVPDNWWHDDSYHNLPLDEFYGAFKKAIKNGYSAVIAIDVSEPGKDPKNDVMFVPDYDIPAARIDGLAREYRFAHKVTTDDHGVHVVGHTQHAGHDWFLIKDSGRSSRRGRHKGYYFIRGDYIRLKVLAFMVHRDAVKEVLKKFPN